MKRVKILSAIVGTIGLALLVLGPSAVAQQDTTGNSATSTTGSNATTTQTTANNQNNSATSTPSGSNQTGTTTDTSGLVAGTSTPSSTATTTDTSNANATSTATANATTTPGSGSAMSDLRILAWLILPRDLAGLLGTTTRFNIPGMVAGTSTQLSATSSLPYAYINGYPTIEGNYFDCNGNIDNDMAHHTANVNDTDPAHNIGKNCQGGAPMAPNSNAMMGMMGSGMGMPFFHFMNGAQGSNWMVIPLTRNNLSTLLNTVFSGNSQ
jgi:hypothetical protein